MITIDTCGQARYNPLIPAMKAICRANPGDNMQIIMDNEEAFKSLKEYLSEQNTGFREIYDEDKMTLQFIISVSLHA